MNVCSLHRFPAEFLDLYPKDLNDIPLATDPYAPVGMPQVAWHPPADVHGMNIPFNGTCNETRARNFRRGYYAAISYTDHNIGVLLNELDTLNLTQTTTVVVMGDVSIFSSFPSLCDLCLVSHLQLMPFHYCLLMYR